MKKVEVLDFSYHIHRWIWYEEGGGVRLLIPYTQVDMV